MKKTLLLSLACGISLTAAAVRPVPEGFIQSTVHPQTNQERIATRGEGSVNIGYAGEPANAYALNGVSTGNYIFQAIEIPVEDQQPYIGCQITAVNFFSPTNDADINIIEKGQAFVTDNLEELPVFTTSLLGKGGYDANSITLAEPFTITGEKPVYVGYRLPYPGQSYYLVVDQQLTNVKGHCMVAVTTKAKAVPQYSYYGDQIGNLCISATVTGNIPENIAHIKSLDFLPCYQSGKYNFSGQIVNMGANAINSATLEMVTTGGTEIVDVTLEAPAQPGNTGAFLATGVNTPAPGQYELTVNLLKVNGNDVALPSSYSGAVLTVAGEAINQRPVIEEGTGAWCQYCPAGIVMMEYLKDTYPEWIRIAAHNGDRMALSEYQKVINVYFPGLPGAYANRFIEVVPGYAAYPDRKVPYFEEINNYVSALPTYVNIKDVNGTCGADLKVATINVTSSFALDTQKKHGIIAVAIADNVGPYDQVNAYSGSGICGEWTNKPNPCSTMYDDVAMDINSAFGDSSFYPASIVNGTEYTATIPLNISKIKSDTFRVAIMIANMETGLIVQAEEITLDRVPSAVEGIEADFDATNAEYFTLEGRRVNSTALENGIYIVRSNGQTRKVMVK